MADNMGFVIPFKAAKEATNVFVKADAEYTAAGKPGKLELYNNAK